jgi:hypothetical protein
MELQAKWQGQDAATRRHAESIGGAYHRRRSRGRRRRSSHTNVPAVGAHEREETGTAARRRAAVCASRARPCLSESRYRSGARRAEMTAPSCRPTRRALARRLRARVGRGALRRPGCRGHVLVERYFPLAIPSRASLGPRASASCAAMSATPRGTCARHVGSGSAPSCSTMRVTRTAPAPGRATMTELVGHLRRSPEGVGEGLQASKPRRLPALEEQRTTATRTRHHRGNRRARRPRLRARRGESDDRATGLDPQRLRPEGPAPAA